MRLIENLVFNPNDRTCSLNIDGVSHYLTNSGRAVNEGNYYTWIIPNGQPNEVFGIFADGNLLENNLEEMHFVLNRRGTIDLYLISVDNFRNNMRLIEEN